MRSVRKGRIFSVYHRLETADEPVHIFFAPALYLFAVFESEVDGRIFRQSAVALVIALDRSYYQRRIGFVEIIGKSPALAVCGVAVRKKIVTVEHIHHGETPAVAVIFGKIYERTARFALDERGNFDIEDINHSFLLHGFR